MQHCVIRPKAALGTAVQPPQEADSSCRSPDRPTHLLQPDAPADPHDSCSSWSVPETARVWLIIKSMLASGGELGRQAARSGITIQASSTASLTSQPCSSANLPLQPCRGPPALTWHRAPSMPGLPPAQRAPAAAILASQPHQAILQLGTLDDTDVTTCARQIYIHAQQSGRFASHKACSRIETGARPEQKTATALHTCSRT